MADKPRLAVFERFIQSAGAFCTANLDTAARMKKIQTLLEALVGEGSLREHSKSSPSTEGHKNLLLCEDPDYGFVVNAVVRTPGREGRVPDHAHAWTAYGVLDGLERLVRSVAVIVLSERLVGKVLPGRYDAETDKYHESDGPAQVAFAVG